jgi:hypothetical protein
VFVQEVSKESLAELVEKGLTATAIAAQLERSVGTIRRLLRRYDLRTHPVRHRSTGNGGRPAAQSRVLRQCARHGETEFVADSRSGYLRCKRCRSEAVSRRRRRVKETLVAEAGGECQICGYSRCLSALHFHHLDPAQKRLGFGVGGITLAIDTFREEALKCVLLCSNCHAEVEAGLVEVPIK